MPLQFWGDSFSTSTDPYSQTASFKVDPGSGVLVFIQSQAQPIVTVQDQFGNLFDLWPTSSFDSASSGERYWLYRHLYPDGTSSPPQIAVDWVTAPGDGGFIAVEIPGHPTAPWLNVEIDKIDQAAPGTGTDGVDCGPAGGNPGDYAVCFSGDYGALRVSQYVAGTGWTLQKTTGATGGLALACETRILTGPVVRGTFTVLNNDGTGTIMVIVRVVQPMACGANVGPGAIAGEPTAYFGEACLGAPAFVPARTGRGLVAGKWDAWAGVCSAGAPDPTGYPLGPGVVAGSERGAVGGGFRVLMEACAPGAPEGPALKVYQSDFNLTENPISEGNNWRHGGTTGLDWHDMASAGGRGFGTQVAPGAGTADSSAHRTDTWSRDYYITGKFFFQNGTTLGREVEIILRETIAANSNKAFEVDFGFGATFSGIALAQWNGPIGNFTPLSGSGPAPVNGEILGARVRGTKATGITIEAYKDGKLYFTTVVTPSTTDYDDGAPGFGHYLNGAGLTASDWGFEDLRIEELTPVVAGPATLTPAAANVNVAGVTPVVAAGSIAVLPAAAAANVAAVSPVLVPVGPSLTPAAAVLNVAAVTPALVTGGAIVAPANAGVNVAAITPSLVPGVVSLLPAAADVQTAGITPVLSTAGAPQTLAPGAGVMNVAGITPVIVTGAASLTPAVAPINVASTAPTLVAGAVFLAPGASTAQVAAVSPTLVVGNVAMTPVAAGINVAANASTILPGGAQLTPARADISVAGISPVLVSGTPGGQTLLPSSANVSASVVAPVLQPGPINLAPVVVGIQVAVSPGALLTGAAFLSPAAAGVSISALSPTFNAGSTVVTFSAAIVNVGGIGPVFIGGTVTVPIIGGKYKAEHDGALIDMAQVNVKGFAIEHADALVDIRGAGL